MDSGITVTGTGQTTAPADLLRLTLSVGHDAADVAAAVAQVAEKTDAVHSALSAQGVEAKDIATSSVNVYPQYKDGMTVAGYRASHSLTVTTRDLTGFGRLLNAAVDAAGNNLGLEQLQFDVADKKPLLDQARQLAFAQAREKAAQLAELAGQSLGSIAAVAESHNHAPFQLQSAAGKSSDAYSSELSVTPGEQSIELSLEIQWSWA
ncbi:SIMPL domain-containing protein [Streptomyces sp. SID13031]|uniref:SIMPL domain-containing protein n=1 Tax=Streptomyces sp. SID13031 TaxID=2706046 RepID=UPI0013C5B546|nr:SIMPL domain-containing protein [Streptomyces sp. SID13031]NEA34235.1 SIMPL domain-containing protein [Streptomyces sp. SID13031]